MFDTQVLHPGADNDAYTELYDSTASELAADWSRLMAN